MNRPPPDWSVVMVACDSGQPLARAAAAVLAQRPALELIVVDNASRDGSLAALPPDPRLRLVLHPDNRGFAQGCNRGAGLARSPRLLFLNPDCFLPDGALDLLDRALDSDSRLAIVGAALRNADGSAQAASRRRDPRPLAAVQRALGLSRDTVELRDAAKPDAAGLVDAEAVSGALMAMPRQRFQALGGFDPGYVLHCEDLDLCRRARAAGGRVALAAQLQPIHLKGVSSRRRPVWVEWHKHRGMWRYFRRFDAASTPAPLRWLLWLGLWLHFALAAPRAWWRSRRPA